MNSQENKQMKSVKQSFVETVSSKDLTIAKSDSNCEQSYAVWIRALLQNWRQGTVGCKNRSEVAFANRKPWKQKGTGRARAGSARSPLWRKGGIIFGPQPRTRTLKLSQQAKSNVLQTLFVQFMEHKRLLLLNWQADNKNPSTKSCYQALKEANIAHSKITLFLTRDDVANWMAFRNIPNIQIISFDDVNAYTLSHGEYVVVLKKDFDGLKEMVAKWN